MTRSLGSIRWSTLLLATGCILALGAPGRAQEEAKRAFEAHLRSAFAARDRADWSAMEAGFRAAYAVGFRDFNEHELRSIACAQRRQGKLKEAVETARYNHETYPGPWSALELVESLWADGQGRAARGILARALSAAGRTTDPNDASAIKALRGLYDRIAVRTFEIIITTEEGKLSGRQREDLEKRGYYRQYVPTDTPYQRATWTVTGARRTEEARDAVGNRFLKVFPSKTEPVRLVLVVRTIPTVIPVDGGAVQPSPPAEVRRYLKKTPCTDPTTEPVRTVAKGLKGKTPLETVRNVQRWWGTLTYGVGGTDSETTLTLRRATCTGQSDAACALLRHLGIPTRTVRGFSGVEAGREPGGHTWLECWLDGAWLPIEARVPPGGVVSTYVRFAAEPNEPEDGVNPMWRLMSQIDGTTRSLRLLRTTLDE